MSALPPATIKDYLQSPFPKDAAGVFLLNANPANILVFRQHQRPGCSRTSAYQNKDKNPRRLGVFVV
jgi:hypothetical protein